MQSELPALLDRIKRETALIVGSFYSTMLRNEIFDFAQIGAFIERADNTARILDVKYHLLLPSVSHVGTILDNYQWEAILRSVAAHRSYRWVYDVQYKPIHIADYLILNGRMPRSCASPAAAWSPACSTWPTTTASRTLVMKRLPGSSARWPTAPSNGSSRAACMNS